MRQRIGTGPGSSAFYESGQIRKEGEPRNSNVNMARIVLPDAGALGVVLGLCAFVALTVYLCVKLAKIGRNHFGGPRVGFVIQKLLGFLVLSVAGLYALYLLVYFAGMMTADMKYGMKS
jgi:hypothetical protein